MIRPSFFFAILSAQVAFSRMLAGEPTNTCEQFYNTPNGEMIMNPTTFSEGVKKLLIAENRFILANLILGQYDLLYEIGCADSSRAEDVVRLGARFHGIDVNQGYVEKSLNAFQEKGIHSRASAGLFSANKLDRTSFHADAKRVLIVYPFNLLGNIDDFHLVLTNMIDIGHDFCFSTYKILPEVAKDRSIYYQNCGCSQVRYSTTPIGDLFNSADGLHSAAFRIGYLSELLFHLLEQQQKRAKVVVEELNGIGWMVYVSQITPIAQSA